MYSWAWGKTSGWSRKCHIYVIVTYYYHRPNHHHHHHYYYYEHHHNFLEDQNYSPGKFLDKLKNRSFKKLETKLSFDKSFSFLSYSYFLTPPFIPLPSQSLPPLLHLLLFFLSFFFFFKLAVYWSLQNSTSLKIFSPFSLIIFEFY